MPPPEQTRSSKSFEAKVPKGGFFVASREAPGFRWTTETAEEVRRMTEAGLRRFGVTPDAPETTR
jgi:hypothetical protein